MSKELEALEKILEADDNIIRTALTELEQLREEVKTRKVNEDILVKDVLELTTELRELRATPTADEVCEAIDKWLDEKNVARLSKVRFGTLENAFFYYDIYDYEVYLVKKTFDGNLDFDFHELPPHLINLISRFYMGLSGGGDL